MDSKKRRKERTGKSLVTQLYCPLQMIDFCQNRSYVQYVHWWHRRLQYMAQRADDLHLCMICIHVVIGQSGRRVLLSRCDWMKCCVLISKNLRLVQSFHTAVGALIVVHHRKMFEIKRRLMSLSLIHSACNTLSDTWWCCSISFLHPNALIQWVSAAKVMWSDLFAALVQLRKESVRPIPPKPAGLASVCVIWSETLSIFQVGEYDLKWILPSSGHLHFFPGDWWSELN